MKATLGLILACGACCAAPFVVAALIGAGTVGMALSFWQLELGAAVAVLAVAGGMAIWWRRNRAGASCTVADANSKVDDGCCSTIATEEARRPG